VKSCKVTTPTSSPSTLSTFAPQRKTIFCFLLVAVTALVYFPALHNGFVNYDDPRYITGNSHIQSGLTWQSVRWAATAFYESNWHPLTWISHATDISLFHLNPAGHHAVSILLHALNTLLLFLALVSATKCDWESFFVAALFALHPLNVESVAWASERKSLLCATFLFLALFAYGWYVRKPGIARYALVAVLFALGLASKPMIITLPFALLLVDYWPLNRLPLPGGSQDSSVFFKKLRSLALEKLPLLLLSAAGACITIIAQARSHSIAPGTILSVRLRLANALWSYLVYILKGSWPLDLASLYPHPENHLGLWKPFMALAFILLVTYFCMRHRQYRYLIAGWLWYLGCLVPVIGIVQVGAQAMADRYAYVPFIGLFCMVVWGASDFLREKFALRQTAAAFAVLVLIIFAGLARRQIGFWRSSEILWNHTLQLTERNFLAHDFFAQCLLGQGRFAEGCAHFQSAANILPNDVPAQEGLAVCAQARGDSRGAIDRYENALSLTAEPTFRATAFANLGSIYRELGDYQHAKENYDSALQLNPDLPLALVGSGLMAQKRWDYSRAASQYERAMHVEPTSVGYLLLAKALQQSGRAAEAALAFEQARRLSNNLQDDQRVADGLLTPRLR
jgi:tetratricopeptide (TPR) repeat protein